MYCTPTNAGTGEKLPNFGMGDAVNYEAVIAANPTIAVNCGTINDAMISDCDALTEKLSVILADCATKSEAERTLSAAKDELTQIADSTLESCGFDYKTRIVLTNEHFPEKDYGGYTFPEGDYDAMLVLLGEGTGENWWCVAFPPLCFVPGEGDEVVYRSWVKEKLDELFGRA